MSRAPLLLRVPVVLAGAWLVWALVLAGTASFGDAHADRVGHLLRAVLVAALAVPLVVLARRHLDRRPWAGLGLTRGGGRLLLLGAGGWLAAAAVGTAVVLLTGLTTISVGTFPASTLLLAAYLPVLVLLFEALPEELLFRGYLYRNLADALPRWAAVVGQAVLFTAWGALIGAAGSLDRVILFLTFSLALGALRVATGSLWAPLGFHLAFQYVAQFLGAAMRDGAVVVDGRDALELVAFWFVPIVVGTVVLVLIGVRRGVGWGQREPDPAVAAPR